MSEHILESAESWGFFCFQDSEGNWIIQPKEKTERWQLSQTGERWLLAVGGVAQIDLTSKEASIFLKRRLS